MDSVQTNNTFLEEREREKDDEQSIASLSVIEKFTSLKKSHA
jgi:hypothetical protein